MEEAVAGMVVEVAAGMGEVGMAAGAGTAVVRGVGAVVAGAVAGMVVEVAAGMGEVGMAAGAGTAVVRGVGAVVAGAVVGGRA
jgi:hypothetical protein